MKIAIGIFLVLGVAITLIAFTLNPFSKRTGLLIMSLGIIASFTVRLVVGIPIVGIGVLFLIIHFIYHHYC